MISDILKTPPVASNYEVPSRKGEYVLDPVSFLLYVESTLMVTLLLLVFPTTLSYLSANAKYT